MEAGSSIPDSRNATIATVASPMKKTSFPISPVCQPITASLTPTPEPAYQSMKVERARISPEIQVTRSPAAQIPSGSRPPRPTGGGTPGSSGSRKKSEPCTPLSMGDEPVRRCLEGTVGQETTACLSRLTVPSGRRAALRNVRHLSRSEGSNDATASTSDSRCDRPRDLRPRHDAARTGRRGRH